MELVANVFFLFQNLIAIVVKCEKSESLLNASEIGFYFVEMEIY